MKTTLKYETTPCGRCGGSGQYSYCSMYGTRCFKCAGRKTLLSRAGATAKAAITAFVEANFSVPVTALVPGDRVTIDGQACTVTAIQTTGGSRYSAGRDATGADIWQDYVTLHFAPGTGPKGLLGRAQSLGLFPDSKVTYALTGERWAAVVAHARTLRLKGLTVVDTQ